MVYKREPIEVPEYIKSMNDIGYFDNYDEWFNELGLRMLFPEKGEASALKAPLWESKVKKLPWAVTGGIGIPPTAFLQLKLTTRHSGSLLKPIEVLGA